MSNPNYQEQLEEKVTRLTSMLAQFNAPALEVFESPDKHYRMRAEFRVWHDGDDLYHIMFDQVSKKPYRVDQFEPACEAINKAMQTVISKVKSLPVMRRKLFQIDYLSGMCGELVISMLYHKPLDDEWTSAAEKLQSELRQEFQVSLIGRARKQKIVLDRDYIVESLPIAGRSYSFMHIENSFTQPNAAVNINMIEWAGHCSQNLGGDLLEFYCGAGNFSLPLAEYFDNVVGTEIAKPSVKAAQFSIQKNAIDNVIIARLSAEEFVDALAGNRTYTRLGHINLDSYNFTTVLVDPPRAGLDAATLSYVQAYDNIIYISCNPDTLRENLATLTQTHRIERSALFDQFPFTHHIEAGVLLTKRR
ncbi:tRNA (uridine(54)-C5)-methyltransferase TrmA [Alteromonas sediminis]|uniref:tRNA/tmRNA (uracil-C(5))-methyltransferase n=1 Tax=Alteromonas sediminis TaxID=2259342 RepID=A0A3N5Y6U1_9ALTE|nr:tRNA (uridine(54)-C5)-methyltransferase TrmA [Alteromonas sediminis]RPJ66239.1 tRNA (uridine(54)-C5)-methyltransferase TrmA [Alteromonas sediminis]